MASAKFQVLGVIFGLLMPCLNAQTPINLPLGQVTTGTISAAGQTSSYTLTANAGDVVDFTMTTTSGSVLPRIRLYSPTGALLNDQAYRIGTTCESASTAELNTVTLSASGIYTVLVGDCNDSNTGAYNIYAQRVNNPSGASALPFGQVQSGGTLGSAALDNTYTFTASANDVVDLTMTTTSGSVLPRIRLYSPTGALLNDQAYRIGTTCESASTAELNTVTLSASGIYTVLVGDCNDSNTGAYNIYAQRVNNPSGASALPFGQVQSGGTLGSAALDNTYTFTASANDVVDLTMTTTSGSVLPRIRLYSPTGALLNDQAYRIGTTCESASTAELNTVTLSASGIYTVLVGDCNDSNTGAYNIYAQRVNNPSGASALPFGQVQSGGTLGSAALDNTYTFTASANDVVDLTMTTTSGSVLPRIRLYSPTGALLNDQAYRIGTTCESASTAELNTVTLSASGIYTVLVGDCNDSNTGAYNIYAQRVNNPSGASALPFGQVQSGGTLGSAALDNTYTFTASANDVVDLTMTTTSGSVLPRIRLYSPTGALLNDQAYRIGTTCESASTAELNTVTLSASGTYTVLVGDCNDSNTGAYNIYAQRTKNPANPITVLWGQKQTSLIGSAAYSDTYSFNGANGDSVNFTVTTTSGSMNPRIRLYSPAGALLNDQAYRIGTTCESASTAELNTVTLSASGTYTVLVGDCNDSNTGAYTLTPQCTRIGSSGKCTAPSFLPNTKFFHDTEVLSWAPPSVGTVSASASLSLSGPISQAIGTGLGTTSSFSWDTTTVPDGNYQLTLTFLDANENIIATAPKQVLVNNSVVWHSGTVQSSQTWTSTKVQGIDANLIIPSGVTVTIKPGTIIKVVPGVGITVQSGGVLNALGTTSAHIVFTSIEDSSVGGDTMLDGGIDNPASAQWDGVTVQGTGQFNTNSYTQMLYWQAVEAGTITASEVWSGSQLYQVTASVTVPNGATLTIQPGVTVKFGVNTGITVQPGGTLIANGTVAQPIYFTSIKDDSVDGDTNGDGNTTSPAAGDWGTILINGGTASFDHVQMSYGGGPVASTAVIGMIQTTGSARVTIADSTLSNSFWDGVLTGYPSGGDTVVVGTSVLNGIEGRGVNAWPGSTVHVVNDTFDNDGVGVFVHGGSVDVANTIITNTKGISGWGAVEVCCGGTLASVSYSDVWANASGVANYGGVSDPTGTKGNISANPVFVNEAQGNYRLNYGSPAIDAANGLVAHYALTDIMGDPRHSDPEVVNKAGVADSAGNYPDMGAFEFVQNAVSDIDFTVTSVTGPANALAGNQVQLTWTVTNIGFGTAVGPWHDSVYLVQDPDTNPVALFAGQVLVGSGVVMGPGTSYTNTATIRVPGSTVGNAKWEVKANTAGDIFEGQNISNNTGLSLAYVATDLPQLQTNGTSQSNSFAAAGQSWWYKLIPGANETVGVNLSLTGNSGSVQLFVAQGYVPTPQQFDIQQQQFNSPTVSGEIPNTSTQIYYATAYAQTLPSTPAAFSISAAAQQFSLNFVQPSSIVSGGNATVEFIGSQLTNNALYQIVGANGAAYIASSVSVSDSAHVYATFAAAGIPTGTYTAQVIENGTTLSLNNSITVTAASAQPVTVGQIAYDIQVPSAVRAGYGGVVTIHYQNTGYDDVVAPLMALTTTGATTYFRAGSSLCASSSCSPNFATLYTAMVGQGQLLGINQTGGPVGVLPAGAEGSVSLNFTAGTGNNVQFGLYTVTDPTAAIDWASASSSMQPSYVSSPAWSAIFANFTNSVGTTWGQYNAALAADATYLGQLGIQEYRVSQLQAFELMRAGLDTISRRYYLGAFGYGASHPFDIWGEIQGSGYLIHYPNGSVRAFVANPSVSGQFIGGIGDYATLAYNSSDQSVLLTEKNGTGYHFLRNSTTGHVLFDYIQDLNGNRITATYTNGLVTSATSSTGDTLTFTYDSNGRITQATDPVGRVTTYSYDSTDTLLLGVTNSSGTIGMTYVTGQGAAQQNALQSVTWHDGTHTYYAYDAQGRLTNIQKDGGVQPLTLAYAQTGAVTLTDAFGNAWQISPDANGSLAQLLDPLGNLTQMFYDPEEKLIRTIGADGSTASLAYDTNGNPKAEIDPLGNQLTTQFAANGDLLGLTDSLGNATEYGYDGHYNATGISYPDTRQVQATYDSRGNITSFTNRRGQAIQYTYNSNNSLTQKTRSNGVTDNYTYDSHRNLQSVTDSSSGTTNLSYDSADRLLQVTYPNGRYVKYAYDSGGRRSGLSDQTGYTVNYAYDNVGRLAQLTSGTGSPIASYTYDADGRLSQKNLGNGAYSTYAYDAAGSVIHLINYSSQGVVNSRFDYTYDATGRKTAMTTLAGPWQYGYDAAGQLTSATPPSTSAVQYTYDAAGNRIASVSGAATTSYNVNNLNQYTSVGGYAYSYDADGDMISKQTSSGTWTYTYDDEGKLLTATGPSGSWTYQYDSFGNRMSSVNGSTTNQYLVDPTGIGSVEAEFDGTGTLVSHFADGLGLESSTPGSGAADFYQFDDSGNTAAVTGAGGSVLDAYSFLPFGEKVANSVTVSNSFTYVGQFGVGDDGNGLYYMRARYYDPYLGRFITEDPAGFIGGINLYTYVQNASTQHMDPFGYGFNLWDLFGAGANVAGYFSRNNNWASAVVNSIGIHLDLLQTQPFAGWNANNQNHLENIGLGILAIPIEGPWGWFGIPALQFAANHAGDIYNFFSTPSTWSNASICSLNGCVPLPISTCMAGGGACTVPGSPSAGPTQTGGTPIVKAPDPNGKITVGYGNNGYIPPDATITYTIYFETQASGTAPAARIVVTDPLDSNLDWSTVQIAQIGFNNVTLTPGPVLQTYSTQAAVSTSPYPVTVSASLNPGTGTLTWTMQSIDPTTGEAPADPLAGFLPPDNSTQQGEGYVIFTVKPKSALANGTAITNTASIVFDANPAISTNTVTNTIDAIYPTSSVASLPAITSSASFPVSWSGSDPSGAGIATYDIFTAADNGPYTNWLTATSLTTSTFIGSAGHTYSFYSMATDNAGQRQQTAGPVQTTVTQGPPTISTLSLTPGTATSGGTVTLGIQLSAAAPTGGVVVTLSSSNSSILAVPTSFTFSGGQSSASLPITLGTVLSPTTVTVTGYLNSASQQAQTTVNPIPTKPSVSVAPSSSSITTTQALQVMVTVSGAAGSPTPTGSVTLTSGSYTSVATNLSSGSATITVPSGSLAVGNNTLTASYAPDSSSSSIFLSASGTASSPVTVAKTTPAVTVTPSSSSITTAQALTVTVAVSGTPTPTGSVTLTSGSYTSAAGTLSGGTATISIPAGSLATGSDTLTVSYTPDSSSSATYNSASGTGTVTVTASLPADFQISVNPSTLTIVAGQSGTATFTVTPLNGFNSPVSFACSGLPSEATCSFNPASVTPNGAAVSSTLIVTTTAASAEMRAPILDSRRPIYALVFPGLVMLFGFAARRRRAVRGLQILSLFVLLALAFGLTACGGGSGAGENSGGGNPGTPTGTDAVTVWASASGASGANHTATLTITITH